MFLNDFVEKSHLNLMNSSSRLALAYLVSRGLNLEEIKKFKIGFSPNVYNLDRTDDPECENFSRWLGSKGSFIKKRLVFPIYDEMGKIRGIETRALDKRATNILKPKFKENLKEEINKLSESEIRYKKFYFEKNKFLSNFYGLPYAMQEIWETKTVILTEGIFDLISVAKFKKNCLSPLTANMTHYQINWLKRYANTIILMFDMDEKGKQSAEKIKKEFSGDFTIHIVNFKGKDLNDFLINNGEKDLKYLINSKLESFF
jgi:DNA primase